jgi:type IV secretion system protein VirB1
MLLALALDQLLYQCAPNVGVRTMTAIVRVESGGQPLAIHDNTLHQTFVPRDAKQGEVWANQLLGLHHSIDLGLAQINAVNLPRLGMTVRESFDPCINVNGAATILSTDYRAAAAKFGPGQYALRRALGAYNSGSLYAGYEYVLQILAAAGVSAPSDFVPNVARVSIPAPSARPPAYVRLDSFGAAPSPTHTATIPPVSPYASAILVPISSPPPGFTNVAPPAASAPQAAPSAAPAEPIVNVIAAPAASK